MHEKNNDLGKQNDQVQSMYKSLRKKVLSYNLESDEDKLYKAFTFSKKIHKNQKRDSGEPYITHPLAVALILADYYADDDTIIAALLHDCVEDSEDVSVSDIKKKFGEAVSHLVDGVTKIRQYIDSEHVTYSESLLKEVKDIETIRKVLKKSQKDIRVLFIKLADRLHNMQTLSKKNDEKKRKKKARETFNIYAPLARRLGMMDLAFRLEDLSLHYIYPKKFDYIQNFLKDTSEQKNQILQHVITATKNHKNGKYIDHIQHQSREMLSLMKRYELRGDLDFRDDLTIKIVVKEKDQCYLVLSMVREIWTATSHDQDYIASPRDNGYRAYHTKVLTEEGVCIDFRIMTDEMEKGNKFGMSYYYFQENMKEGQMSFFIPFNFINNKTQGDAKAFIEATKIDLLEKRIKVFCEGKGYDVPYNTTALDVAFQIDTQKALKLKEIFINENKTHISSIIEDGDIVEMSFEKNSTVAFRWLYYVKTATARIAIQEALQSVGRNQKIQLGERILQREFDFYEKGLVGSVLFKKMKILNEKTGIKNIEDLYILIAEGNITASEVFRICFPQKKFSLFKRFAFIFQKVFHKTFFKHKNDNLRFIIYGILDRQENIINAIYDLKKRYKLTAKESIIRENPTTKTFSIKVNCSASNKESFHHFILNLESQHGLIRIAPLMSYRVMRMFFMWILIATLAIVWLPFLLEWVTNNMSENFRLFQSFLVYISLLPVLLINYALYFFIRNYFASIRNSLSVISGVILLNAFALTIFIVVLIKHSFALDIYIILSIFFCSNFIFLYQYLVQNLIQEKPSEVKLVQSYERIKGYFFGLAATSIWGINPIMIRHVVTDQQTVFFTVGMRLFMGGVFLMLFLSIMKIFGIRRQRVEKIQFDKWFWFMVVGLTGNFYFFHWGLRFTTASNANLIENFAPIVILLVMGFLVPKISGQIGQTKADILKTLLIVFIGSMGASLVLSYFPPGFLPDENMKLYGDFIEIIAMLFFALFIMSSNVYMKKYKISSLWVTAYALTISALLFTPVWILEALPKLTADQWFWLTMIGVVSTGIAYSLWNKACQTLNVIPASLLLNFTVIVTLVVENQTFGLPLGTMMLIGSIMIIIASISAEYMNIRREKSIEIGR